MDVDVGPRPTRCASVVHILGASSTTASLVTRLLAKFIKLQAVRRGVAIAITFAIVLESISVYKTNMIR